jgi:PIN domain nuclease of toxin-antitoxin system
MRLLLDTSVVLWSAAEDYKLNSRAKELLSSKASELYLSSATVWEIAIKFALGSLKLNSEPEVFITEAVREMNMQALQIAHTHAIEAGRLPKHHRDPFDRMLIAQAQTEGLVLLTADRVFQKYRVELILCGK